MNVPAYVLVSGDFVKTGGMDRANHALASYLLRRGDQVTLVAHRVDADLLEWPGASFRRASKPLNSYLLGEPLLRREGRRWARRLSKRGARVVVNGGNCGWGDVNWVHYVHAAWTPGAVEGAGRLRAAKTALAHRLACRAERVSVRRARMVIANSEGTRRQLVDRLGLPAERVHTVYYGVDATRFRPATGTERREARRRLGWDDDRPSLAFVGALGDRRKGLDTLTAAWRRLVVEGGWDARLIVIGAGASLDGLKDEARDLSESLAFLGFRRDVPELLRACDALVSPTRYEAYGLNVHEAICCGLPALVSKDAGAAERYPEELAELLIDDPGDPGELVHRLRNWRENRKRLAGAVALFGERLRAISWDDMARRFLEVVEEKA